MKNFAQIREISTLSFNERVLQEAEDVRNPLMERLKFLGIFSSNMDEFFKVRVASIQRRIELGKKGMNPLLRALGQKTRELDERFQKAYASIIQALSAEGIRILTEKDIAADPDSDLARWLHNYIQDMVLPNLVPIILHHNQPFPQLVDSAIYFGIQMWGKKIRYALLEIPQAVARFVELPNGDIMYIDDVIRYALNDIFYIFEYDRIEAFEFKISRDAELDIDNDFSEGYVRKMERVLNQRKGGRPTRLVYDAAITRGLRQLLVRSMNITQYDTLIPGGRYHNMKDLMRFPNHRPDLSFKRIEPAKHPVLDREKRPLVDIISDRDILITYPYQSFDHVIRLLREAAIDPRVEEIKMTLYRAARNSQVVNALVNAARNGKKVFVSIELQARFDEQNNIKISDMLTEVGATVVYGVPPMKVHCKLLLIRKNKTWLAGLSTGNFNEATSRLYVDSMLFTSDTRLIDDVVQVFDFLDRAAKEPDVEPPTIKNLLVSPFNSRRAVTRLLDRERAKGEDGYVFMKVNHLTDTKIVRRIREAADEGVKMDLIVRTTYALRPHPNIRAISILDRFLEHQRAYIFGRGEDQQVFMSSADLMERNLDWRIEAAFPIFDPVLKEQVVDIMTIQANDNYKARILDENQSNPYVNGTTGTRRSQYQTHQYYLDLYAAGAADKLPAVDVPVNLGEFTPEAVSEPVSE